MSRGTVTGGRTAQAWIGLVLLSGCACVGFAVILAVQASPLAEPQRTAFWIFLVAASAAHAFPVVAPRHQAYHATPAFLMPAILLLSWPAVVAIVLTMHATEWLRRRRPWYVQLYNVAAYLLSAGAAMLVIGVIGNQAFALHDPRALVAAGCAVVTFLLVNHALTAMALRFARGVSFAESGLFGLQSLGIDGALLLLGIVIAGIWAEQPVGAVIAAAPLVLIYRALRVANVEGDSHRDSLTGLYNGRHFEETLEQELHRARHTATSTGLLMIVLDDVPKLVQAYGRSTLDLLLLDVTKRIAGQLRPFDLQARLGEEGIGVLLPGTANVETQDIGRRVLTAVARDGFAVATARQPIRVTVSIAAASLPPATSRTAEALIHTLTRAGRRAAAAGPEALVEAPVETPPNGVADLTAADAVSLTLVAKPPPYSWIVSRRLRAFKRLWLLEAAIILPGLAVTIGCTVVCDPIDAGLATGILVLVTLSELLAFDLYDRTSFSISFAPILAAGLLGGPTATLLATWSVAVLRGILRQTRWDKVLFNGATYALFGLAATAVMTSAGSLTGSSWQLSVLVPASVVASSLYYLHTFVIATVMGLDAQTGPMRVWTRNFRWLYPHYVVLGALGVGLAVASVQLGPIGSALFLAPLVMMRFVLKQYTDRTTNAVHRLEAANADLVAASSLLQHRGDQLALLSDLGHLSVREPQMANLPQHVAERCVPTLGEICSVMWSGADGLHCAVQASEDVAAQAELLRTRPPETVAALAESVANAGPLPDWVNGRGTWCALPLAGSGQPLGWILSWGSVLLTEHEKADRIDLMREVAGRLGLVLERDALLEEAAAVDALRAVDRAKSDFIAITAHELRTPLTSVQGYAELLRNEVEPGLRNRWLGILQVETAQLGVVLDQLLDVSQLDSGQFHARRRVFDLDEVVSRSVDEFTSQATLTGHCLQTELAPGLPGAFADPTHISRVLRGLISNALKYSPAGGDIWIVAVQRSVADIEVCIEDEGLGIPPEYLDRLFARFQRVDLPDRASIRGTGLGLYIARQLVEVNGGRIWAESDGAGRGAQFHFTLAAVPSGHCLYEPAAKDD